ncbi:TonB-dependent receptor [Sphingobacterium pedocola]|nr:TonB-dependent receptor [Sphingobacterium pedocola]
MRLKLTITLLTICCLQLIANGQRVTLKERNAPLAKVLSKIEKQSGYTFFYNKREINLESVYIEVNNESLSNTLDALFKGKPYGYEIQDKIVVLNRQGAQKKTNTSTKNVRSVKIVQQTLTGIVRDIDGNVVSGVSILVKGTARGASTDTNGRYQIEAQAGETLIYQIVGFHAKEVLLTEGQTTSDIVLESVLEDIDEVVVVGYGVQKKETVTGSIASIQTKEIKQSPAANLAVTLAGRLPGLTSIQRSGEPGRESAELYLRGVSTINSQNPIILVDGVERELTYIDPNEVESVTILKDASSTAIFGTRGANGVILVTTRRGKGEKPQINFSSEFSLQDFTRSPKPVNSYDYAVLKNLALENEGRTHEFTAEQIEKYRLGNDPMYPNTSWQNILLKDYAPQHRYNLNVSGAGKMAKYFVNAGYINQGGQFKTEKDLSYDPSFKMDRYNFRSNIDIDLNKRLKAFMNVAGYLEKLNSAAGAYVEGVSLDNLASSSPSLWILAYMNDLNATLPGPLTPDGQVLTSQTVAMPSYGQLNRTGYVQRAITNVTATYGMEHDLDFITKGLSAKAIMSYDTKAANNFYATKQYPRYIYEIIQNEAGENVVNYRPYDSNENTPLGLHGIRTYQTRSNVQAFLNYQRSFAKHNVTGLLLFQQEKTVINAELPYNLRGFSGRLTYGYADKYFAEFNAGYNGSEQFAKGKRFGFFPAVSGAWLVSNEDFFKNDLVTLLKVRGSYGHVGNDRIGGRRFLYLDNIQMGGGGSGSLGRGQTINISSLRNADLTWELAKMTNIGLEVGLWNELTLNVDMFRERRDNILIYRQSISRVIGLSSGVLPPANMGKVENKGYEIELNYKKRFNADFSLFSKAHLSYARNKVLFIDEPIRGDDFAYRYTSTGYSIGQGWGYLVDRFFYDDMDIATSPVQNVSTTPRPGDFKYRDLTGDGIVDEKDMAPIGHPSVPEYTLGGALGFNYKGFDFSALLQGVTNVSNFYRNRNIFPRNNFYDMHLNSWTKERADNGDKITYPRLTTLSTQNEWKNDYFTMDASYLRLKNMEIGYTLGSDVTKRFGINSVRIYGNGFNLFTWDRLPTRNFDPELSDELAEGYSYPVVRYYNVGLNIIF